MTLIKTTLFAGAAISLLAIPAAAAGAASHPNVRPLILAQAEGETEAAVVDPVAAAEQAVEEARAALRKAMATGGDVGAARRQLRQALQQLDEAKRAAEAEAEAEAAETEEAPPAEEEAAETPPEEPPPEEEEAETAAEEELPREEEEPETAAEEELPPEEEEAETAAEEELPPEEEKPETAAEEEPPLAEPTESAEEAPPPDEPSTEAAEVQPSDDDSLLQRRRLPRAGDQPRFGRAEPEEEPVDLPTESATISEGVEIRAGSGRIIIKEDGQVTVRHDDTDRFRRLGGRIEEATGPGDTTTTTITRPNGTEVVTVRDEDGNILQRYRKAPNGQIEMLIGEAPSDGRPPRIARRDRERDRERDFDFHLQLPPLRLQIPQEQYIVESSEASEYELEQALVAPPVEQVERAYSLEEIRRSNRLRDKVRRVDLDEITFEFGSAELAPNQIAKMERVGDAIRDIVARNDRTVLLIEGHTDAVGSDLYNLALSDRRAETVAEILTYYFGIPPENLITQGYGEQFLKIPTVAPERLNRRVAFRNITRLIQASTR